MTKIHTPRKLIEVALPLDDINAAAAREKSIRHGHPSTLHLWWARRPLAAARAVLFAQMVNDPGYQQGEGFKYGVNKKEAELKREKLFAIIRDLVKWENTNNEEVLNRAREAIKESWRETCELNKNHPQVDELFNPDQLPAFHDPFAGGGAIPLEAQRLGLEAYASDLNPVAVMINKAMIEIPPKFAGIEPVGPVPEGEKQKNLMDDWSGAQGLAEDVRRYGHWMREEAFNRIGHLYPRIKITEDMAKDRPDLKGYIGQELTVIAWLWARTVKSPNPAFSQVDVPLVSSFVLSSKKGKEAYIEPVIEGDTYHFEVRVGNPAAEAKNGTKAGGRGASFICLLSGSPIDGKYIKAEGQAGRMGQRLMAIVAEGNRSRVYLPPTKEMEKIAYQAQPTWRPTGDVPARLTGGTCVPYGLREWGDLFTPRQLVALTTFSDLVAEARNKAIKDYLGARASRPRKTCHRSHLPHFEAGEHPQHITFRLADSLPQTLLKQWDEELKHLPQDKQNSERRQRIETALDQNHGQCHLKHPEIAEIVHNALLHFNETRYQLHTFVVAANHVHVLVTPLHGYSLSSIVHSWKSFTARQINKQLGREGVFWQADYFDRLIRNQQHYNRVVEYIQRHPGSEGILPSGDEGLSRAGRPRSEDAVPLADGGTGATAYGDAVAVYLGFAVDKSADYWSTVCSWHSSKQLIRNTFGRQAIPMTWDYVETNPFSDSTGNASSGIEWSYKALHMFPASIESSVSQQDAANQVVSLNKVISTDPPYYDNIGYADLSDFFYVWMRRSLRSIYPDLFATMAVPKAEELVATPYRHGSKEKAETFFLDGMTQAIHNMAKKGHPAFPVTIYYAFKQSETKDGSTSNTGWETFLDAVIRAGFSIDGTWPMRTEMANRMIGSGTNALASSVVLVCKKRHGSEGVSPSMRPGRPHSVSRRQFQRELREKMPEALEAMIGGETGQTPIAPVDLAQAAIGPGMAIYSRYDSILEADGSRMSVHEALILINRAITDYLSPESGNFDADTQFCSGWFEQYGWSSGDFGEADTLARAKGTSVDGVHVAGVIESGCGHVRLLKWKEYPGDWDPKTDNRTPVWEAAHHLIRALNHQGETTAGALLARMPERGEAIRQLAYHLYTLCERKGRAEDARAYNELIGAWQAIVATSHDVGHIGSQTELDFQ